MSDKEISTLATSLRDLAKLDVSSTRKEEYLRVAQRIDNLQILQKATIYYKRALSAWGSQHPDATTPPKLNLDETQKEFEEALKPFLEDWLKDMVKHFNKHTNTVGYSIGGKAMPLPEKKT